MSPPATPTSGPIWEELAVTDCSSRRSAAAFDQLHAARYGLPAPSDARPDALSIRRLADAIELQTQCKQAHLKVNGSDSSQLHRLFEDVDTAVAEYVEFLAAGVGQRESTPDRAEQDEVDRAGLDSHTLGTTPGDDQVARLGIALATFGARRP